MATHIHVVLREDVAKLGKTGELVRVKPGFARNFLLPRGYAVSATEGQVNKIEHEKRAALARAVKLRSSAEAIAKTLNGMVLEAGKQAGEDGRLYGSVTTAEISALLAQKNFEIDRKKITIAETIKSVGEYDVTVKLSSDISATLKLKVSAKA